MRRYVSVMQARQGIGDNITEEMYYAPGENGKPGSWMVHYNSDRIRQEYGEEGIHAPAAQIFGFTPEISPETDSDIRNSLKDKKIFKSDGSVTDNYLVLDDMGEVTLASGLIQQQTPIDKTRLMSDIAASVTPIAQGNLKSGNLANIDWTQEIRPWLVTQIKEGKVDPNTMIGDMTYAQITDYNTTTKKFGENPYDLQVGDSNIGGSKWTMESQGIYETLFRDYAYDLVGPKQDYVAGSTRKQSEPTAEMKNQAVQDARKQERFNEIKNLPLNKKTISDYFVGKDFDNKRILEVKEITQRIENGVPNKIISIWVNDGEDRVLEKINITNDFQINNLLDQLSDPGAIPTGNLPIKK